MPPGTDARGLGKLLVVAHDQINARRYADILRSWVPSGQGSTVQLATSDERDAHETLARFRLTIEPSVLVTVAMAYEGLDAPEVAVVAALTHIRSRAWLEQMVARATRIDPHGGPYAAQRATVFHPDDPMFARFRHSIETEQGTIARACQDVLAIEPAGLAARRTRRNGARGRRASSRSRATRSGYDMDCCGLAPISSCIAPSTRPRRPRCSIHPPSWNVGCGNALARWWRNRLSRTKALYRPQKGRGLYHRYNAILKRCTGDKPRAQMSVQDLEAAVSWLERNRLADHAHLLEGDPRYGWAVRQRGEWKPPVGNADGRPRGAPAHSAPASDPTRDRQARDRPGEITRTGLLNKPMSYPT